MRQRRLKDNVSGQEWASLLDGVKATIRSGGPGKQKAREKLFDSDADALRYLQKEEASRLKKGWTLAEANAGAGEPVMQRFLSGDGYTGALPIAACDGRLICGRYNEAGFDTLYEIGSDGVTLNAIEGPPGRLIWDIRTVSSPDIMLLRADHEIVSWSREAGTFAVLAPHNSAPASALATSGPLAAWYEEQDVVVTDLASGRVLFRHPMPAEQYGGHSYQMCLALSDDGATLACCSRPGAISLFDLKTGNAAGEISGEFSMIEQMAFAANDSWLIAQEQYGAWRLRCFDVQGKAAVPHWPDIEVSPGTFALSATGSALAVANRTEIEVFDLPQMRSSVRFRLDHAVKNCSLVFMDDRLGVVTDLGFVALYSLA